ncbi:unnamed protein product [Lepeophtheirus salmonis]|uniref:(salmon louse) hypothetical protein n=1 Tax=Lepeophtheirus salmonis TaxID=72036 RepID=A0A7R8H448_LEPSM|nr:unnamed protein product [Lepeophtheirus salmonis]CAF2844277.1 unnamed protein product [Lepeophtheirus salmonis]
MITKCLFFLGLFSAAYGQSGLEMLSMSIPGEPGVDYPIFDSVQDTGFSCDDKVFGGYYADPAMGCQAYHVCLSDPIAGSSYPASFLCPNGTIFQQKIFNCDWWYNERTGRAGIAGTCPAIQPRSEAECAGTVSTCWSPGFTDTDCPNFGLCCFDGCQDICVDEGQSQSGSNILPTAEVTPAPRPRPTPRPTQRPTPRPTQRPTPRPTQRPTPRPTQRPAPRPTQRPTPRPTQRPTQRPRPTPRPTARPTPRPTTAFNPVFEANKLTLPTKSTTPANDLPNKIDVSRHNIILVGLSSALGIYDVLPPDIGENAHDGGDEILLLAKGNISVSLSATPQKKVKEVNVSGSQAWTPSCWKMYGSPPAT